MKQAIKPALLVIAVFLFVWMVVTCIWPQSRTKKALESTVPDATIVIKKGRAPAAPKNLRPIKEAIDDETPAIIIDQ
jgi:hypothetical protein